ncbi:hypothetical protein LAZ40_14510 [Cereibacter sphaeroides]|uniref:hypothetical protein n=1 Tax=Cereibacter sphaeroides TaxID=1063 RepID=UPI001F4536DE|nr:hypothetical protein [Cereibacter sphaeroides]MCE6960237.1 hypothetical protein [Cereibacter sphaeroides]MCE6969203.1 hypothetical protein [Cereibacter sphaeroides]MCE6974848.1 hypothetical protein [Cereibacter sphaeroides]
MVAASPGRGHNRGPALEPGRGWRLHCWTKARADLLPTLPIEILRNRVRRAAELGLDYRTYASVRASTGHDVVAFLFSSNALRVFPGQGLPADRAARLERLAAGRIGLAQGRLLPDALLAAAGGLLEGAHPAPPPFAGWSEQRRRLRTALGRIPSDQVILVGDAAGEREWAEAARLAGYIAADRYMPAG